MKNVKLIVYIIVSNFLLWSCAQEVIDKYKPIETETPPPAPAPTSGDADFSKYVAVGNSLTAGYMNGALYNAGQVNSLAAQLAKQFALAGGGAFNQPDINSEHGFLRMGSDGPLGRLILKKPANTPAPIGPGDIPTPYTGDKSTLNNFGVPGITLLTALFPQTGGPNVPENPAFNALYARFASNPGSSTIIGDAASALANGGTFFTFWLGNNDVLGYAVGGASNPDILTSTQDFEERYRAALGALMHASPEAEGMVANIPNVIDVPFFKTVPYNAIPLDELTAIQLTAGFREFNEGITAYNAGMLPGQTAPPPANMQRPLINFVDGQNGILIEDEALPDLSAYGIPSIRLATSGDLITLTAGSIVGKAPDPLNQYEIYGITIPLSDGYVLIPQEQQEIQERINDFNSIISTVVSENNARIGLVNINTIFNQFAQTGFSGNNIFITSALAPPFGAFSLDGVHPNSRGYAYVANQFIIAINEKFNATVPLINIAALPGNELPQ